MGLSFKYIHTYAWSSIPSVPGQDLYSKCASVHSAVYEILAVHRES